MLQLQLLPCAVSELFAQVTTTHVVTKADQYGLLAAILTDSLSHEERRAIDRLLHAASKKRICVINEISALAA